MAEIATIARPYAEALFRTSADAALADQVDALGAVAADAQVQALADNPRVGADQVFSVFADVLGRKGLDLAPQVVNLLRTVIDNGRVAALAEIAAQYRALVSAKSGVYEATLETAYPMDAAQLAGVLPALETRFGRKLRARVVENPSLIGGIRVVVGDEVLDTSVKARLEQMKAVLTA